mgnify:CR=1 FL=1
MDSPNYSLNILMPKTESALKYFKRYSKFYLQGDDTCWRVEAVDSISTPGILEVNAVEYFANEIEDDIENGIVGGLLEQIEEPTEKDEGIIGDTFIKVKKFYKFSFKGELLDSWFVDGDYPIELIIDKDNPKEVSLKWTNSYSGQFDLYYGDYSKTIIVESLF